MQTGMRKEFKKKRGFWVGIIIAIAVIVIVGIFVIWKTVGHQDNVKSPLSSETISSGSSGTGSVTQGSETDSDQAENDSSQGELTPLMENDISKLEGRWQYEIPNVMEDGRSYFFTITFGVNGSVEAFSASDGGDSNALFRGHCEIHNGEIILSGEIVETISNGPTTEEKVTDSDAGVTAKASFNQDGNLVVKYVSGEIGLLMGPNDTVALYKKTGM